MEDKEMIDEINEAYRQNYREIKANERLHFFLNAISYFFLLMIILVLVLLCYLMLMYINCPAWIIAMLSCVLSCVCGGLCGYKYAVMNRDDNVFYIWTGVEKQ